MTERRERTWTRAALSALLAAVIAVLALMGGSVYQWCVPMARAMDVCCCDHPSDDAGDAAAFRRVCCEERTVDVLPAAHAERSDSAGAPLPASSSPPIPELDAPWIVAVPSRREHRAQHRPRPARPPPLHRKLALIQVYRC